MSDRAGKWRAMLFGSRFGGTVGALVAAGVGLALVFVRVGIGSEVPIGDSLVKFSYDLPFRFRSDRPVDDIVIVSMDDVARQALGQGSERGWSRDLHAELLNRMIRAGSKLVVMDLLFGDTNNAARLARAMRDHKSVIIGADLKSAAVGPLVPDQGGQVIEPCRELAEAALGVGIVSMSLDEGFTVRRHFDAGVQTAEWRPSLTWLAADVLGAEFTKVPSERSRERWLNYYGAPGTSIPRVSYHMAYRDGGAPLERFARKTVFVGSTATAGFPGAARDEFATPYTRWNHEYSSGVEIHATALANLMRRDWIERCPWVAETMIILLAGLFFGWLLAQFNPVPAAFLAGGGAAMAFGVGVALQWKARLLFPWAIVALAQIPAAFLWSALFNSFRLYGEKKALERSLELHLSPARARQLRQRPDLLKPGAELGEVSILFSDIANFSNISGRMHAGDLFKMLNRYFEVSLGCVHETEGTVVKLIGDAIYAIWNAPFAQEDHRLRACRTALLIQERLLEFEVTYQGLPLQTRIGLHAGEVFVGNVGSTKRFDYTAIGDNVNIASRLEGLNKYLGTSILATRDVQRAAEAELTSRLVGHFRFKGISRLVEVHELIGRRKEEATQPWKQAFASALFQFQRKQFERARADFLQTLELRPGDGPSLFYLDRIAEFTVVAPPADWSGEIELKEK